MRKYNEEYFSVIDKKTGKKLLDCGDEIDAITMVNFAPHNRTYTRNKFLMGQVVDIEMPKALPTNEIVDLGGKWDDPIPPGVDPWNLGGRGNKLPEGQGEPVRV
jgi:hypothetical protein